MRRDQLEHLIRAPAGITGQREFIVVGSQAVLGQFPVAPAELLGSIEADLFCPDRPEATDLVDGTIGEQPPFHQTFGYYAHGVGPDTAVLPPGWEARLVRVANENTGGASGLCLEVHDLAVSKLAAGRDKDFAFVDGLLRHGLASADTIRGRIMEVSASAERKDLWLHRLQRLQARAS